MKKTPFKRSGRIRPKKRSAGEFARVYGSKKRVEWMKRQACIICGTRANIQNAHTENGGMGRKADYQTIVPMCGNDHWKWHHYGIESIGQTVQNLRNWAALTEERWQAHIGAAA